MLFPHISPGSINYTENSQKFWLADFLQTDPQFMPGTWKKESPSLKNRRQKCNLYALSVVNISLQLFELFRHAKGISTHWVMFFSGALITEQFEALCYWKYEKNTKRNLYAFSGNWDDGIFFENSIRKHDFGERFFLNNE